MTKVEALQADIERLRTRIARDWIDIVALDLSYDENRASLRDVKWCAQSLLELQLRLEREYPHA